MPHVVPWLQTIVRLRLAPIRSCGRLWSLADENFLLEIRGRQNMTDMDDNKKFLPADKAACGDDATRSAPGVYRESRFHLQSTEDLLTFPFPFPFSLKYHIAHYRQHPLRKLVDGRRTTGCSGYSQWTFGFTLSMQRQINPHALLPVILICFMRSHILGCRNRPGSHKMKRTGRLDSLETPKKQNDRSKKTTRKSKYYCQEHIQKFPHIVLTTQTLSTLWLVVEESVR